MEIKKTNKLKQEQTATAEKYPQGYFKPKKCRYCNEEFIPKAPSEHYCSDSCKDLGNYDRYLYRNYGINLINYKELLEQQNNKCAICGTTGELRAKFNNSAIPLVVDHNHKTGEVRGLLCHTCNTALGQFNDSKQLLTNAITYLNNIPKLSKIEKQLIKNRPSNISKTETLNIIMDSIDNNLSRKELMSKYERTEAVIRSIVELKTQQAKQSFKVYLQIKESATTIPNGSTSQVIGDGSGLPTLKSSEDIV